MFGALKRLGNNLSKVDTSKIMAQIIAEPSVQAQIIDANQAQMYEKGVDAEGETLGEYSKTSVEVYGKRPGHITLRDTGEFYDSMKVQEGTEAFMIFGDMEKEGTDLTRQWPHALGLTQESIALILPEVKERAIEIILTKALG